MRTDKKQKEAGEQTGNRQRLANRQETERGWRTDRKYTEAGEPTGNRQRLANKQEIDRGWRTDRKQTNIQTSSKLAGGKHTCIW